jgi:NAD(P)-dependent dehydrogenase (short-subunit alcohol dehydrogenase family)
MNNTQRFASTIVPVTNTSNPFQFLEHSKTTHALGRVGEVDEVAKAITFLAGADSSFTTGVLLPIDGGRGIMTPR